MISGTDERDFTLRVSAPMSRRLFIYSGEAAFRCEK
jgi:hypothetical protein